MSARRWVAAASLALAWDAGAQSLASRVSAAGDGPVMFHFASRPGVCGDGLHFIRMGHSYHGSFSSNYQRTPCDEGPVEVKLTLRDGEVSRVESYVGRSRDRGARDLGAVSAAEGARYLLELASRGPSGASSNAIFPAVLADSAVVWPTLFRIARDTESRSSGTRQDALFWLSRFAAGAVAGKPNNPFDDADDEGADKDDLKAHAVFVLSQLPHKEGIPALLDIARQNPDSRVRGKALFWLGQSGDSRALTLFETILR